MFELIKKLPEPKEQLGKVIEFKRLGLKDNNIPKINSLKSFYDRIRMLDDESYPNSYIEYGDFIIEFNNAKLYDDELSCKAIIKLKNCKGNTYF